MQVVQPVGPSADDDHPIQSARLAAGPPLLHLSFPPVRRILRLLAGIGLCILGIIGWLLPVMPGWAFMIPGLIILSDFFPPLRRALHWARDRAKQEAARFRKRSGEKEPGGQPPA